MIPLVLAAAVALPPVMPLDRIAKGQRGTCLTVFEGDAIEPFDFVVKGLMENFLGPHKDVVLVRLVGDKAEFTGVVAGMSGSPCSIDGKLVGALAYAFSTFAKEPIAGITPIRQMREVMAQPPEDRPWRVESTPAIATAAWDALRAGTALPRERSAGIEPIATPLTLSGVIGKVREHFTPWLRSAGFYPVAGGASGTTKTPGAPTGLRPGDAVAAVLVTGDVSIAATGTVTWVDGDQVLAFGHPFLGTGVLSVPMARATILNTMASMERSFKMSQTGAVVGEVTQDRSTAIGGYLGHTAAMVPVRGKVVTAAGTEKFSFQVARDQDLSPRLVAMGLANALYGGVSVGARGTVRLEGTVRATGFAPITVRSIHAAQRDGSLLIYAAIDMARTVATMWDTPFGPPPDMALDMTAMMSPDPIVEWIETMNVDRGVAKPGEPLDLAVRIRREDGPVRFERFHLQVPHSWAGQEVELIACSGTLAQRVVEEVAGDPRPKDLAQVRRWLSRRRPDGYLYLLATREGEGMRAEVDVHAFLPPSMVAILSGDATKQRTTVGLAWEERREQPGALLGGVRSTIRVLSY